MFVPLGGTFPSLSGDNQVECQQKPVQFAILLPEPPSALTGTLQCPKRTPSTARSDE